MTLANFVVRDPFERPVSFDGDELRPFVRQLVPPERLLETVLFTSRATRPQNVIGAKASRCCDSCGFPVWLSPSSQRLTEPFCIVCLECLSRFWRPAP